MGCSADLAGLGLLAALVPILTLAVDGDRPRRCSAARYVVDNFALVLKALVPHRRLRRRAAVDQLRRRGRLLRGRVLLPAAVARVLGMVVMASARDLITIFVALELLSIPAYLLAAWRKRDLKSNEAGMKYYLMGVFASAVMLYGMSLLFGVTRHAPCSPTSDSGWAAASPIEPDRHARHRLRASSASRSRSRRCRSTRGRPTRTRARPTPVTAFLSVASKAAGFVALLQLVFVGLLRAATTSGSRCSGCSPRSSMTVGNLIALRQTNIVRLLAYSSIAQARLHAGAARGRGRNPKATESVVRAPDRATSSSTRR